MRRLAIALAFLLIAPAAYARGGKGSGSHRSGGSHSSGSHRSSSGGSHGSRVGVKGYTKKNGTYVAPHTRSAPNHSKRDNWSSRGNVNPTTGKTGTKDPNAPK